VPKPVEAGHRYVAGLDGLRAFAVVAVIVYHLNVGWAQGGLLGVGVFFTLSGYLITDLLLEHWGQAGGLGLADFWIRRARRLLPALIVMLAVVFLWVAIAHRSELSALRGNVVAASLYMSNWWLIFQHVSYFARFGPPSPLGHLWSLAIEEQFYLLWPWLLWLGLLFIRYPLRPRGRRGLAVATLILATCSTVAMAVLYHPGFDPSRVYDGTDTRAFGLLIGAALAMVWPSRRLRTGTTPQMRRTLDYVGLVGLIVICALIWRTTEYSAFPYRGGMLLLSIATSAVIMACVYPGSRLGRILGMRPIRWIGVRSYGIYLWHYPVIVLTTVGVQNRFDLPRATVQATITFLLAALSWRFVEEPIRQAGRQPAADGVPWHRRIAARWTWAVSTAALAGLALTALIIGGVVPAPSNTLLTAGASGPVTGVHEVVSNSRPTADPPTAAQPPAAPHSPAAGPSATTVPANPGIPFTPIYPHDVAVGPADTIPPGSATTSSCRSVVHIGDSTSESLISPNYLPNPGERLGVQYARVGATNQYIEITGGTSIVETISGGPNAYDIAKQLVAQGYQGCWVIALGTNDSADVYVGSHISLTTRIERMMSAIGDQPVMWVNARSLVSTGPYSESDMQKWDRALAQACPQYPNMKVYDWASIVQPSWFIPDGIHYNTPGSAERAHLIASALADAFPISGQRGYAGCVIP
jgi:peptidoglycan/LPS O-acetylase OafA/YrhL